MLEPLLAPYAALAVVAGSGVLYWNAVSHHLGLLAAARSDWSTAIASFESALGAGERVGAHVWNA
jgi:hypothetical protein